MTTPDDRAALTDDKRRALVDRLDRSYDVMPQWVKSATWHAMGAPAINPATSQPFRSFREALEAAADHTLLTLRDDFDDNGDLLPEVLTQ